MSLQKEKMGIVISWRVDVPEKTKALFSLEREITTDIDPYLSAAEKNDLKLLMETTTKPGAVGEDLYFKRIWKDEDPFELILRQQSAIPSNTPAIVTLVKAGGETKGYLMSRSGKTLLDFLNSPKSTAQARLVVRKNLEEAVEKMHANGFVHGDLWLMNILVTPDLRVMLIDPHTRKSRKDSGEEYLIDTVERENLRLKAEVLPYLEPTAKAPEFGRVERLHVAIVLDGE